LLVGLVLLAIASATASTQTVPTSIWRPRFPVTTPIPTPPVITPPPIPAPPVPSGKPVLQASDFVYLGAIRMPEEGVDTTYSYGGLTGRMVDGKVHLFVYGNSVALKNPVYELEDPGDGYNQDYRQAPRARLVTNWGDIFHGRQITYDASGVGAASGYFIVDDLHWNETTKLLYWTYYDAYNVTHNPDWAIGASSLDDPATASSTAYGPWRTVVTDGDGNSFYGPWRCLYLFANPFDNTMMCGSMLISGISASPWGPDAYGGAPWPTAATPAGFGKPDIKLPNRYLEYYFMAGGGSDSVDQKDGRLHGRLRSARRVVEQPVWEDYQLLKNTIVRVNPATNGGVGSWSDMDYTNDAIWLELANKHGVIYENFLAGSTVQDPNDCVNAAHVWYSNAGNRPPIGACSHNCPPAGPTGPGTTAAFPAFTIYDPDDLIAVKNGTKTDFTVDPRSVIDLERTYGIHTAPNMTIGAAKAVRGFYFDPVRKYLFVLSNQADDSVGQYYVQSLIHVFAIRD